MPDRVEGIRVHQWLDSWDKINWDKNNYRREPNHEFFLFSIKASELKRLSGIYRRKAKEGEKRTFDTGIQRSHDAKRSKKIKEFVEYGYPYCDLNDSLRNSGQHESLRKPGWLPTGIVINILTDEDCRNGHYIQKKDAISIKGQASSRVVEMILPEGFESSSWAPTTLPPVEVIDGQHRLWAFDDDLDDDYEMPVIAFYGLDISWQAYLFWSINITPVRINRSLAFDMYPLLRAEDWVDKVGHKVYQEARAQEVVESLWSHNSSPWKNKINMLAEPRSPYIRQATWIRAFMNSFIKNTSKSSKSGGLFGVSSHDSESIIPWTRSQQTAFIIYFGNTLLDALRNYNGEWINALRRNKTADLDDPSSDAGMFDKRSLLNTDQGIRSILSLLNDVCVSNLRHQDFIEWHPGEESGAFSEDSITKELSAIDKMNFSVLIKDFCNTIVAYDWRTAAAPELDEEAARQKMIFRGSGGYVELKKDLIEFCIENSESAEFRTSLERMVEATK